MKKHSVHPFNVILFDGVCNFCNSSINFAIKRDKNNQLKFAAMQSTAGSQLLQQYSISEKNMQSFIFIQNGIVYNRSTAALKVCTHLNGGWPLLYGFIIVPKFIRDGVYNFIAKNRYKWFGKKNECMVPSPAIRAKFLV
jgi:predicted DCC family thiol-disulfide oxidoreductase YuxK